MSIGVCVCRTNAALMDTNCRYRHASDKLHKMENVMEKYKKKLEEGADLRRRIKVRGSDGHRYGQVN